MADDNVMRFPRKPLIGLAEYRTGNEPTNLRDLAPDDDAFGDAMVALGFGKGIPHHPRSTRVAVKTLRELREMARAEVEAHRSLMLHAQERERVLTEIIGDGDSVA